jgi:hypothetical protein
MAKRGRGARSYARASPVRQGYPYILIACEGAKSEPYYLNRLRHAYRLSSARVRITPAGATDPMGIVSFAEQQLGKEGFDRAYCVFDRDSHTNYAQALQRLSQSNKLVAINSVPCFEIWVLLHFKYSTAPFNAVGNDSACDRIIREIQKYLPQYTKGLIDLFDVLHSNMDTAITHAGQLATYNVSNNSMNPATQMHTLVNYLKTLGSS